MGLIPIFVPGLPTDVASERRSVRRGVERVAASDADSWSKIRGVALTAVLQGCNVQMFEHGNVIVESSHTHAAPKPMPHRLLVTKELADFLGVLSHPHRIRIVEELRDAERDVNSLQEILGISHSGVSQHLTLLRSHRLVSERREGRRVFYQLRQPEIASWLMEATRFLEKESAAAAELRKAIDKTRKSWATK